jgi:hypothetical protein
MARVHNKGLGKMERTLNLEVKKTLAIYGDLLGYIETVGRLRQVL